ncbi:MAG: ACP S-malonyltransferase [Gemmatimonadota bacterium]
MSVALLFPGQGSQYVGMGKDLAAAYADTRQLYERADETLGVRLSRISWEGPPEALTRTENAQPAILLHGYAVFRLLPAHVRRAAIVAAGHSLGELTAHLAAGTFSFEDALRLVRERGRLMADAGERRPGTMSAILGLDHAAVASLCEAVTEGIVVPANFNSDSQVVISGDVAAVARAEARAREAGARRVVRLNVSGAFHSPLMEQAREGLGEELRRVEIAEPSFPVVSNAWGSCVTRVDEVRRSLMEQLTVPVRWTDCLRTMAEREPAVWLELGPGGVLSGLLRRMDRARQATAIGTLEELEGFCEAEEA